MTIGQRIQARRKELGHTQRSLAALLGYKDHTTLAGVERGLVDLPHSRLMKIAEVLNVSPSYLLGLEDDPEGSGALAAVVLKDPRLRGLVENYLNMDDEGQEALAVVAKSMVKQKG